MKSWEELKESYETAKEAISKDEAAKAAFDTDGDGTIGPQELLLGVRDIMVATTEKEKAAARKKVMFIMKCIDPNKILDACVGLWTGLVAVLATLRSRMVHCVGIGAGVGNRI